MEYPMTTLSPMDDACRLDGRRRLARRIKTLVDAFTAELSGNPSPVTAAKVKRAAELLALPETARSKRLAGDTSISFDDLVRRAMLDLGLPTAEEKASDVDWDTYLQQPGDGAAA
jgi:hypothetical protein